MLVPDWVTEGELPEAAPAVAAAPPATVAAVGTVALLPACRSCGAESKPALERSRSIVSASHPLERPWTWLGSNALPVGNSIEVAFRTVPLPTLSDAPPPLLGAPSLPLQTLPSRWSASAWAFLRRGESPQLAAGGTLGGSQIGGRISYRINDDEVRPLSVSAGFYAPLGRPAGSEAAMGLEWKPIAELPVRLLAERRQKVGREGRSAFAAMAYGGVSEAAIGPALFDAYAQAGVVGVRSRDLFADGSVAITLPIDEERSFKLGAGAWAAAQPGVSRLDVGPQLSIKIPGTRKLRLNADWRVRIAGDAAPASGPSLTLATEF